MTSEVFPTPPPITARVAASAQPPLQIPRHLRHVLNGVVLGLALLNAVVLMIPGVLQRVAGPASEPTGTIPQETLKKVTDRHQRFEMMVPSSWQSVDNPDFALQVGSSSDDMAVAAFVEAKSELKQFDAKYQRLEHYSEFLRSRLADHFTVRMQTSPTHLIINGLPAIQAQVDVENAAAEKFTFLHTVVETPTDFYTIRAVISSAQFPSARSHLEAVTASFRVTASSSTPAN